ncbi:MAG TPA: cytochrome b/b6 domain-containing protein [Anaerolineales bacterium]|nr:cytochrome b/b6 domain-containing protein [Anaerolineales bacterium]
MQSSKRYHPALVTIHWLMALLVFVNLYLGIVVFENRGGGGPGNFQATNPLVPIHMAVGVTILVLLILRFILRLRANRPVDATTGNKFFDALAKFVHYGLYVTVLAVTVLGLTFSLQTGRFQSAFLGAESQFGPPNGFPVIEGTPGPGQFTPPDGGAGGFPEGGPPPGFQGGPGGPGGGFGLLIIHELAAYTLLVLVALHIFAALYHQFFVKDNLIARMWYGAGD